MLNRLGEKENVNSLMNELESEYSELEVEIKRAAEMDAKELMRLEK